MSGFYMGSLSKSPKSISPVSLGLYRRSRSSSPEPESHGLNLSNPEIEVAYENSIGSKRATEIAMEAIRAFISFAKATRTKIPDFPKIPKIPGINEGDVRTDMYFEYIRRVELDFVVDVVIQAPLDLALSVVKLVDLINNVAKTSSSEFEAKRKKRGEVIKDMKEVFDLVIKDINEHVQYIKKYLTVDKKYRGFLIKNLRIALEKNKEKLEMKNAKWNPSPERWKELFKTVVKVNDVAEDCLELPEIIPVVKRGGARSYRSRPLAKNRTVTRRRSRI